MTAEAMKIDKPLAAEPFVRWAGGKRWLTSILVPEIEALHPRCYIEPFLGGGAIVLALPMSCPRFLVDSNATLMDVWRCIKELPDALITVLRRLEQTYGDDEIGYFKARAELNKMILAPRMIWIERAAHALYINARCFNGLWRTNANGYFNVPFGDLAAPKCLSAERIRACAARLRSASLVTGDALSIAWRPPQGAAVYADPPYHGTFSGYTADGFDDDAHRQLASILRWYADNDGAVWTTNADTPLVRELYDEWTKIEEVAERHSVGATGERRGLKGCLLIRAGRAIQ